MEEDIFHDKGIEIELKSADDFLKVKETLTRIGIASKKTKTLFQSVHILHKKGRYVLLHFKELFELDGKPTNTTDNDLFRRNTIVKLLADWGLITVSEEEMPSEEEMVPLNQVKILPYKEKVNWQLVSKYQVGSKVK